MISVTHMAAPACPWAYSALPAITALRWRYSDQLDWRVVTIGLAESAEHYERRGYTPALMARTPVRFARFGVPFAFGPRSGVTGPGRACRAIVAARLEREEWAYLALRALHVAWFTSGLLLDEDEAIAAALSDDPALDAEAIVARLDDPEVEEAYQRDRAEVRDAAGSASALQDKTAQTDGVERYTAPTLVFAAGDGGPRLEAGGNQPLGASDGLGANPAPAPGREPGPGGPPPGPERFPPGRTPPPVAPGLGAQNQAPD